MIKRDRLLKPPVPLPSPPPPPQKLNGRLFSTWPSGILTYFKFDATNCVAIIYLRNTYELAQPEEPD